MTYRNRKQNKRYYFTRHDKVYEVYQIIEFSRMFLTTVTRYGPCFQHRLSSIIKDYQTLPLSSIQVHSS